MTDKTPVQVTNLTGQLDRITVSVSEKVNTGNYESKDVFVAYSTDLNPEFDACNIEDHVAPIYARVRAEVDKITRGIRNGTGIAEAINVQEAVTAPSPTKRKWGTKK